MKQTSSAAQQDSVPWSEVHLTPPAQARWQVSPSQTEPSAQHSVAQILSSVQQAPA
jgi:hypothetical protein